MTSRVETKTIDVAHRQWMLVAADVSLRAAVRLVGRRHIRHAERAPVVHMCMAVFVGERARVAHDARGECARGRRARPHPQRVPFGVRWQRPVPCVVECCGREEGACAVLAVASFALRRVGSSSISRAAP